MSVRLGKGSGSLEIAKKELGKALGSLNCLLWSELWSQVRVKVCERCWVLSAVEGFVGWVGSGREEEGDSEWRESWKRSGYCGSNKW